MNSFKLLAKHILLPKEANIFREAYLKQSNLIEIAKWIELQPEDIKEKLLEKYDVYSREVNHAHSKRVNDLVHSYKVKHPNATKLTLKGGVIYVWGY